MNATHNAGDNSTVVSVNGQIVSPENASIPVFDSAALAGAGVFETMLADGNYVYRQGQHLQRLERSTRALGIETRFDSAQIAEILSATLGCYNNQCAEEPIAESDRYRRIRVTLTGGNSGAGLWGAVGAGGGDPLPGSLIVIVQSHRLADESATFPAEVVTSATPLHWLAGHKSLARMMYSHPAPHADGLPANILQILYHPTCGVTEFTHASLFVRRGETVLTADDSHLFPGICRAETINRWEDVAPEYELVVRRIECDDLLAADEVIGVNSLRGAFSVSSLTITDVESPHPKKYGPPALSVNLRRFLLDS